MSIQKVYMIEGLDCANCAAKLERELSKIEEFSAVSIDFMGQKASFEADSKHALEEGMKKAETLIQKLEPGTVLSEKSSSRKPHSHQHTHCDCGGECGHYEHGHTRGNEHTHEHSHEHHHSHSEEGDGHEHMHAAGGDKNRLIRILISAVLLGLGLFLPISELAKFFILLSSYLIVGGDILFYAFRNILKGNLFDENFLMAIATIGAFLVGEYPEGVEVMLFFQVGELFQSYAVSKSRKSITELMNIRPDYANLQTESGLVKVSPEEVSVGDIIVVKPGEKVPLDGVVVSGSSFLDTSALTGESLPREAEADSEVLSGCINVSGVITVKVSKAFEESTVSKILSLVENASSKKAKAENFITKFARYYTPLVVLAAALLAVLPPIITGDPFQVWVYRALTFLVISCPCALVISIPLSFFGGIGGASRTGILVKGSNYLEALAQADTVVFDKTGTLTQGVFQVSSAHPQGISEQELLTYAALGESYSNHPISLSIQNAYRESFGEIRKELVSDTEELSGYGVRAVVEGKTVLLGNQKLMEKEGIAFEASAHAGTVVHLAVDGVYAGYLLISDQVKPDAPKAIKALKAMGVSKTVMLTGDNKAAGEEVASQLGIDQVYTELLPGDKVEKVEELLKQTKGKLLFVGDGINDAPVLARADIGIAMGGLGSDAAIEAADVVIMTDEPSKIGVAIRHSKRTLFIVRQNIWFALGVKALVLLLGAIGVANMQAAVFADVGVAVLAILNAIRALKVKESYTCGGVRAPVGANEK